MHGWIIKAVMTEQKSRREPRTGDDEVSECRGVGGVFSGLERGWVDE